MRRPIETLAAAADGGDGTVLRLVAECTPPRGANPCHFAVRSDGKYFVALQDADDVAVLECDGSVAVALSTGSPSCVAVCPV